MSLPFFYEVGLHGPVDAELAKLEFDKYLSNYSGIHTSNGILYVDFHYNDNHSHAHVTRTVKEPSICSSEASTPIQFYGGFPHFVPNLLHQLLLLKWSGLSRFLHAIYNDLADTSDSDRQLLIKGIHSARIEISMPSRLLSSAVESNRFMVLLSVWLLEFRALLNNPLSGNLPFQLILKDGDKKGITISTVGDYSVTVSARLQCEVLVISAMDALPAFTVAIGCCEEVNTYCRKRRMDDSKTYAAIDEGKNSGTTRKLPYPPRGTSTTMGHSLALSKDEEAISTDYLEK